MITLVESYVNRRIIQRRSKIKIIVQLFTLMEECNLSKLILESIYIH